MKSILQQIIDKNRTKEISETGESSDQFNDHSPSNNRRDFLKKATLGGIALGGLMNLSVEDTIARTTSNVKRSSSPSDLKITDMRIAIIGDYVEECGVAMAMHMAGSPVCFMANVHCAATTQNFLALEHHNVDTSWWKNLVKVTGKQFMITNGFANVPLDAPGLGIELNNEEVKKHLSRDSGGYFEPTPEWDHKHSHDRIWS